MERTRIKLEVYVDLDPIPGAFHSVDSARNSVGALLYNAIPHYNPVVSVGKDNSVEIYKLKEAGQQLSQNIDKLLPQLEVILLIEKL